MGVVLSGKSNRLGGVPFSSSFSTVHRSRARTCGCHFLLGGYSGLFCCSNSTQDVGDVKVLCESLRQRYDDVTIFPGRNMFFGGVHAVEWTADGPAGTGDLRRGGAVAFG